LGGSAAGDGNIISGNADDGIYFATAGATGNLVQGNYIGLDVSGTLARGNAQDGIDLDNGAVGNTIGGTAAGTGNVISANTHGILISDPLTNTANYIEGNYIGTDAAGTGARGNTQEGVLIVDALNQVIGGTAPGAGNTIAFNGADGIAITALSAAGNSILGNAIHSNGGLGIDLGVNV
jgi:hypothetical protein